MGVQTPKKMKYFEDIPCAGEASNRNGECSLRLLKAKRTVLCNKKEDRVFKE